MNKKFIDIYGNEPFGSCKSIGNHVLMMNNIKVRYLKNEDWLAKRYVESNPQNIFQVFHKFHEHNDNKINPGF